MIEGIQSLRLMGTHDYEVDTVVSTLLTVVFLTFGAQAWTKNHVKAHKLSNLKMKQVTFSFRVYILKLVLNLECSKIFHFFRHPVIDERKFIH